VTKNLLVVDDDPKDRILVVKIFQLCGFMIFEAATAAEVGPFLENGPIDIALVDITLPDSDGYAVSQRIKQRFGQCVVIITSGSPANNKRLYESKGDLFLIKGGDTNSVLKSIATGYIAK
jgi:two-component system, OmpR family, response regulator